jgi:hypothetical protein
MPFLCFASYYVTLSPFTYSSHVFILLLLEAEGSLSLSLSLTVFLFLVWKSANFSHQSVAPTSDTAAGHLNTYRIIQQNAIFMLHMLLFSAPCYIHKQVFTNGSPFLFVAENVNTVVPAMDHVDVRCDVLFETVLEIHFLLCGVQSSI